MGTAVFDSQNTAQRRAGEVGGMIVPKYWADARLQYRDRKRQITVRRFGWSDVSEAEAQKHADARVKEAYDRILAGEPLPRYERRVAYNGGEGVPIREEIVHKQDDIVITRNGYGALCLNSPNTLFADIDFPETTTAEGFAGYGLAFLSAAILMIATGLGVGKSLLLAVIAALLLGWPVARSVHRLVDLVAGDQMHRFNRRIASFLHTRPDWHVRVYRTPAGLRLMAVHRRFDPHEPAVKDFFESLAVDPTFAIMCTKQNCFRARVSPKPWRIGLTRLHPPASAAWRPEQAEVQARRQWIDEYDRVAPGFAACRFIQAVGSRVVDPDVAPVQRLHDTMCRSDTNLPIA